MAKTIFVLWLLGGALMLTVSPAVAAVAQEEFPIVNPTSKAKL